MEPSEAKITTTVTLSPDTRLRLDRLALNEERSRSWIIDRALRDYLANYERQHGAK